MNHIIYLHPEIIIEISKFLHLEDINPITSSETNRRLGRIYSGWNLYATCKSFTWLSNLEYLCLENFQNNCSEIITRSINGKFDGMAYQCVKHYIAKPSVRKDDNGDFTPNISYRGEIIIQCRTNQIICQQIIENKSHSSDVILIGYYGSDEPLPGYDYCKWSLEQIDTDEYYDDRYDRCNCATCSQCEYLSSFSNKYVNQCPSFTNRERCGDENGCYSCLHLQHIQTEIEKDCGLLFMFSRVPYYLSNDHIDDIVIARTRNISPKGFRHA